MTGSAVQWLRDQLGIISGASQSEDLARQVEDNGGVYFVPAFSGLFAPYWRSDARGAIVGLSRFNTNAHLARATLEAICYQSREVVEAMEADSGVRMEVLKVDGGITANRLCMQIRRHPGRGRRQTRCRRNYCAGRGVRGGLGRGFLEGRRRPAAQLAGRRTLELVDHGREARRGLRGLEESRAAHAGLGGRLKAVCRVSAFRTVLELSSEKPTLDGVELVGFTQDAVDLLACRIYDLDDPLLLFGRGGVRRLRDGAHQLAKG